tara:strand:+ start:2384 stop:2881 length:498 start_codon:yes stop_codon:yes gene_type:complete
MEKPSSSKLPLAQQPSREEELVGGIKNGLERGEPMPKIKQSFINAGYKPAEVNAAVSKLSTQTPQPEQPAPTTQPQQAPAQPTPTKPVKKKQSFFSKLFSRKKQVVKPTVQTTSPPPTPAQPEIPEVEQPKKSGISKTVILILIILSALILIGAAILGLYWDKIF